MTITLWATEDVFPLCGCIIGVGRLEVLPRNPEVASRLYNPTKPDWILERRYISAEPISIAVGKTREALELYAAQLIMMENDREQIRR